MIRETILYIISEDELLSRRPNDRHAILGGTALCTPAVAQMISGEIRGIATGGSKGA